jgi:hypothetical protein
MTCVLANFGVDVGLTSIDPKSKKIVASKLETDMLSGTAIYNTGIVTLR